MKPELTAPVEPVDKQPIYLPPNVSLKYFLQDMEHGGI